MQERRPRGAPHTLTITTCSISISFSSRIFISCRAAGRARHGGRPTVGAERAAASGGAVHAVQALCLRAAGPAGTQSTGQADAARGAARRGEGQRGRRTSSSPSSSSTPLMLGSGLLSSMEARPMAWAPATMPAACAACCCTCGEAGARQRGEGRGIQLRPGRKRSCGRHGTIFRGGGRRIAWRKT